MDLNDPTEWRPKSEAREDKIHRFGAEVLDMLSRNLAGVDLRALANGMAQGLPVANVPAKDQISPVAEVLNEVYALVLQAGGFAKLREAKTPDAELEAAKAIWSGLGIKNQRHIDEYAEELRAYYKKQTWGASRE